MENSNISPSPPKRAAYLRYILPSSDKICYAPSMRHQNPPIVSADEIRNAKDIRPDMASGCKILELDASTVLKTSVPVPKVFNAYTIGKIGYIVMEKIPGLSLAQCWKELTGDARRSVIRQLKGFIQEWRQIEGPMFGTVDGGPCEDIFFKHSWDPKPRRYGPFSTRSEYNEGLVEALRNSRPNGILPKTDEPMQKRILASGRQDERKVLTHGDLHPNNIMVKDNVITGIVDWGVAGYSIMAREYFGLRWQALDSEWRHLISTILEVDEYQFWAKVNQSMMLYIGI